MPTELTIATIGAAAIILAALISFIVAVSSAVIAKEQKVSEFRQAWINDFRNDIAKFYAINLHMRTITIEYKNPIEGRAIDILNDFKINTIEFNELSAKIALKLNWDEHKSLLGNISDLEDWRKNINFNSNEYDMNSIYPLLEKLMKSSNEILSNEWKVVKKGEKHFVKFRNFAELYLFAFITAFFIVLAFIKIPELSRLLS